MSLTWLCVLTLYKGPALAQEYRLGTGVQPSRQSVYLKVDPSQDTFSGRTEIVVEVGKIGNSFRFHSRDIKVSKAELVQGKARIPLSLSQSDDQGFVTATSAAPIPAGKYRFRLEFSGPFNRQSVGLYKYTDQNLPYLSSQFEMQDARRCFPCFDEPSFKIPYQMTVEAPKSQRVYNNSPRVKAVEKGDWRVHTFAETKPIPSYLVALAVGPFEEVPVEGMSVPGHIVSPRGKTALVGYSQKTTPEILGYLERYFGERVPYPKLDQLAITEFPFGAMENPGMVTYREDTLLVNEKTAQLPTRIEVVETIAHELAHQWFGNQVTMQWWDDLWLNEAFATWMAGKVIANLYPELETDLNTRQNEVMGVDANLATRPIKKEVKAEADIWDNLGLAYAKGCAMLGMVERWIGEDVFRQGMREYMAAHRFGNAVAADLWQALGNASDKDVESVLRSYTTQSGYPLITLTRQGAVLKLEQRRFLVDGVTGPAQLWTTPLVIRYGAASKSAVARVVLAQPTASLELEFEPDWIMPDDGGVGYFRWSMEPADLDALMAHRDKLSDREKIALLFNLNSLLSAGVLSTGEMLEEITAFLKEPHPEVVSLAVKFLGAMQELYVNDSNRELWSAFLQKSLNPVRQRFGDRAKKGESLRVPGLREAFLDLASRGAPDPQLLELARTQAALFLSDSPEADPGLAKIFLIIAARAGDQALLEKTLAAMVAASDPQRRTILLKALGCFAVPDVQQKALDLIFDQGVTSSDVRILLALNSMGEERRQRTQDWTMANFDRLRKKVPLAYLNETVTNMKGARDQEQLDAMVAFFSQQPDPDGTIGRAVAELKETVRNNIAICQRGQASFDAFLQKHSSPQNSR